MPKKRAACDSDDELAELRTTIECLTDQVACLTTAIDELADHLGWHNNNSRDDALSPAPMQITSLPLDPAADEWQINRVSAADLPSDESTTADVSQQQLFN